MAKKDKGTRPEKIDDAELDDAKGGGSIAYSPSFTGGVRVATGDINDDGEGEEPELKTRS